LTWHYKRLTNISV